MTTRMLHQTATNALQDAKLGMAPAAQKKSKWVGSKDLPPKSYTKSYTRNNNNRKQQQPQQPQQQQKLQQAPAAQQQQQQQQQQLKKSAPQGKATKVVMQALPQLAEGNVEVKDIIELSLSSQQKYKTELCRSFARNKHCRYGAKCQYAHSDDELRPRLAHKKYKSELCRTWQKTGQCAYGARCRFRHGVLDEGQETPMNVVKVEDDVLEAAVELVSEASASASMDGGAEASSESLVPEMVKAIQTLAIEKASARSSRASRSRADTSMSSEDDSSLSFTSGGGAAWSSSSPAKHPPLPRVKAPRALSKALAGSGGSASASASEEKVEISKSELAELTKMCDMLTNALHEQPDVVAKSNAIRIKLEPLRKRAADESEESDW